MTQAPWETVPRRPASDDDRLTVTPEQFGATGSGDDTAAFQAAVDYLLARGGGVVLLGDTYDLNAAPRTDRDGHCILSLCRPSAEPLFTSPRPPGPDDAGIKFKGPEGGVPYALTNTAVIRTSQTGAYSALHGPPSIIGGATYENNGNVLWPYVGLVEFENVSIERPDNSSLMAVDSYSFSGITFERSAVYGASGWTAPAYATAPGGVGIRLPELWGTWNIVLQDSVINGAFATLLACHTLDHARIDRVYSAYATIALAFQNDMTDSGHRPFQVNISASGNKYLIAGHDWTLGAISMDAPGGGKQEINLGDRTVFEWEDLNASGFGMTSAILDANSRFIGRLSLSRWALGPNVPNITVTGATKVDVIAPRDPNLATRRASDIVTTDLATSSLGMRLDSTAGNPKLRVKAKDSAAAAHEAEIPLGGIQTLMGYKAHGAVAGTARPTGYVAVLWVGTATPSNGIDGDVWHNGTTIRIRSGGVWVP